MRIDKFWPQIKHTEWAKFPFPALCIIHPLFMISMRLPLVKFYDCTIARTVKSQQSGHSPHCSRALSVQFWGITAHFIEIIFYLDELWNWGLQLSCPRNEMNSIQHNYIPFNGGEPEVKCCALFEWNWNVKMKSVYGRQVKVVNNSCLGRLSDGIKSK